MSEVMKPKRLKPGDTVAVLSPSWGGPAAYPAVFDLGLRNLSEHFGVKIREYPTTRATQDFLHRNPKNRAADFNAALCDPTVDAIFASIGGEDSIRLLPHLDLELARKTPKIIMGFSDSTAFLTHLNRTGLVTFNGPSIMAGFAQQNSLPDSFTRHIRETLFEANDSYEYRPYPEIATKLQDWGDPAYEAKIKFKKRLSGFEWLQGKGVVEGRLFGGCIEVLEFMKGTEFWFEPDFWRNKVLFLETSEEKPTPDRVRYILRNYGMQGVFDKISALLFAIPYLYTANETLRLHEEIVKVVSIEFGRPELPIVADMDFGHTSPQLIMANGCLVKIDCAEKKVSLVESPVS